MRIHFDRDLLGLNDRSMKRLESLADIREHPLVSALILPAMSGWQSAGLERELSRLQPVFRSLLTALTGSLLEVPVADADTKPARIAAIKKFIRRNFRNPSLDVDEIVAYAFLSRRALYYLFEDEDLPVNKYIRALRTLEALELLAEPNSWKRSLGNIAEVSGFTNLQAMRRAVRETTGLSLRELQDNSGLPMVHAAELRERIGH
ncbi:helix-turn-helix domain-containing protein [Paenarthrobacter sp. NPDC089989]|uniref:helix-turn-helix domain-containing protein n=1 Tax=unclassified Paenarthrobacter TaxID=2634190 RepID=UPI003817BCE5